MTLYIDPLSTTCRPVMLFLVDHHMRLETAHVRLSDGEHLTEAFAGVNPNQAVPVLEEAGGSPNVPPSSNIWPRPWDRRPILPIRADGRG